MKARSTEYVVSGLLFEYIPKLDGPIPVIRYYRAQRLILHWWRSAILAERRMPELYYTPVIGWSIKR